MSLKNFSQIKEDFNIPDDIVYLDNAATAFMPRCVLDSQVDYYYNYKANVHRGTHRLSERATREYELVREKVCKLINAKKSKEIVFTSGTTHSINILASGLTSRFNENDAILVTEAEHHANLIPWMEVSYRTGCRFEPINIIKDGRLDLGHLEEILASVKGKIIFCMAHISNTVGYEHDLSQIISMVHDFNGHVILDCAQSISKRAIDVQALDIDFLAFSGHKLYGPTGVGVLYGKLKLLDKVEPFMLGGDMINYVHWEQYGLAELPYKLEAGTPNIAGVIGLGAAIDWFMSYDINDFKAHDEKLGIVFKSALEDLEYVRIFHPGPKSGLISFTVDDVHPQDLVTYLDLQNIAVRGGFLCAQPAVEEIFKSGVVRASWACYNDVDHAVLLATALSKTYAKFANRRESSTVH